MKKSKTNGRGRRSRLARSAGRRKASERGLGRVLTRVAMKKNGNATASKPLRSRPPNGASKRRHLPRGGSFHNASSNFEQAVERFIELYDFAPMAYVSFDRAGRIEEANLAASQLLGIKRDYLIGSPLTRFVAREDIQLFLDHLGRCRSGEGYVETDLRLKRANREFIFAHLYSNPTTSQKKEGTRLYQTAIVDLTERVRAQEMIRRSEERYRTLFDLVPMAVYACDARGVVGQFNQQAVELWGRIPGRDDAEELFSGALRTYYRNGQLMPRDQYPVARLLRGESLTAEDCEVIVERPDGTRRWAIASPRAVRGADGKINSVIDCLYDVTERRRSEAASQRLAAVVESSHDAIAAKDLNGIVTDWNNGAQRIFGYKPNEIVGKSILTIIPPDRHSEEEEILSRTRRGESIDHYETVRRRKDGRLIDVSLTISPIQDRNGEIIGISKIARDITQQKEAERRLTEQARLLDLTADAIIVRDSADRIVYWNKGAKKMFGYSWEEAAGKITHQLLKTQHPEPLPQIMKTLHRHNLWDGELVHHRRDGTAITSFSRWTLDRDANGNPVSILEINTDVTERIQTRQALKLASTLPEENPSPVMRVHRDRTINFANPAAEKLLSRLGGKIGAPAPREILALAATNERSAEVSFFDRIYLVSIAPTLQREYVNLYFADITRRRKAERALAEAARRQAVLYEFIQRRSEGRTMTSIYCAGLDAIMDLLHCDRASILLFDEENVMRFVAWRGISEKYRRSVEGHSPWKPDATNVEPICLSDVDLSNLPPKLKRTIRAEGIRAAGFFPLVADGKLIGKFIVYHNRPHLFSDDERKLALTLARQLAHGIERQRSAEALYDSEQRTRAMIEQTTVGIARADRKGRLLFVNQPFCKILGYTESELIGQPIRMFTYKHEMARSADLFNRLIREGRAYQMEKRYVRKDGSIIWVSVSASPVRDIQGKVQSVVGVVVDITDRKKAETELRRSKEMLELLVQRRTRALRVANAELKNEMAQRKGLESDILTVSDREQQRFGQELHDGLCQELGAIGLMAHSTALRLKNHRVVQVEDLEKIAQLINNSVIDVRNIARDLHKEEMDAAHFKKALHDLVERKIWNTPCRLKISTQFDIESDTTASELYRILREALMNVNKHARASRAVVEVGRRKDELVFRVIDNGVGMEPERRSGTGLGFHIMNYRAKSIGARLEVTSPKSGGTRVSVYLSHGNGASQTPRLPDSRSGEV